MRKLALAAALALTFHAAHLQAAVTNTEATVTWTNMVRGVTNADTITVNSSIRRYTNGVLNDPALWILSTNIVGHAATNTVIHFNTYSANLGLDYISFANSAGTHLTNAARFVSLIGSNLTITLSAGVGTVVYVTNSFDQYRPVVHPSGSLPTAAAKTNNQSGLFGIMNDSFATNVVANSVPGLTNLLDRVSYQESTNKTFRSTTNLSGLLDGMRGTNFTGLSGSNGTIADVNLQRGAWLNGTNFSGTNVSFTNVTLRHFKLIDGRPEGTNAGITNGFTVALTNINSVSSNHVNYGNAIRSEGSGGNSFQAGSNALATGIRSSAFGNSALSTNTDGFAGGTLATNLGIGGTVLGNVAIVNGDYGASFGFQSSATNYGAAFGAGASASGLKSAAFGRSSQATGEESAAFGNEAEAQAYGAGAFQGTATATLARGFGGNANHSNSVALGTLDHLGTGTSTTATNQIVLGTANHKISVPGMIADALMTNTTYGGTNIIRGDLSMIPFTITSVAAGNNAGLLVTNVIQRITGAPAGAWNLNGICCGRDGRRITLYNNTGQTMTLIYESGVDPVAANRIDTLIATDITTAARSMVELFYDGNVSRWIVMNYMP